MKTIDIILEKIKREGAITAKKLSEDLSMTTMGARQHLQSLEDEGLVKFYDLKVKVGRPTRHWSLTGKGHAQFADKHSDLTVQIIESVENLFGEEGLEKVAADREAKTLSRYAEHFNPSQSLQEKVSALAMLREQDGYMIELKQEENGFILIENHCPICKAAQHTPRLCQSELNVFHSLLGQDVSITRTEHIVNGEQRCAYKIEPLHN
ncbi:transcriptional regulator [Vibrio sp. JC009]|uniref:helix-turn-helix transcriptional regulator n=1 Tax=Vibrio sp. JC009 TaxID=2912314 RepID=UPI0023B08B2D|nr:metalloregulator ArsR/SmtB family transcription factor [Vibrio sp. JC009]WED21656.1 transcriptional regulator [Vibrio sp. JC009]